MIEEFKVEALATMDGGRIKKALEHYVERAVADCADRATLKEARKVTLTISLTPEADDAGELDEVNVEFFYAEALPKRRSKAYSMKAAPTAEGETPGLFFNDLSPSDPKQGTLDEQEPAPQPAMRKVK